MSELDRIVFESEHGTMEVTRHGSGVYQCFSAIIRKRDYDPDEMWRLTEMLGGRRPGRRLPP